MLNLSTNFIEIGPQAILLAKNNQTNQQTINQSSQRIDRIPTELLCFMYNKQIGTVSLCNEICITQMVKQLLRFQYKSNKAEAENHKTVNIFILYKY